MAVGVELAQEMRTFRAHAKRLHGLVTSLVACAESLDSSERHSVMRSSENGCGWCGGDHLAELKAAIRGPEASTPQP